MPDLPDHFYQYLAGPQHVQPREEQSQSTPRVVHSWRGRVPSDPCTRRATNHRRGIPGVWLTIPLSDQYICLETSKRE